jgi:hypothetical protein
MHILCSRGALRRSGLPLARAGVVALTAIVGSHGVLTDVAAAPVVGWDPVEPAQWVQSLCPRGQDCETHPLLPIRERIGEKAACARSTADNVRVKLRSGALYYLYGYRNPCGEPVQVAVRIANEVVPVGALQPGPTQTLGVLYPDGRGLAPSPAVLVVCATGRSSQCASAAGRSARAGRSREQPSSASALPTPAASGGSAAGLLARLPERTGTGTGTALFEAALQGTTEAAVAAADIPPRPDRLAMVARSLAGDGTPPASAREIRERLGAGVLAHSLDADPTAVNQAMKAVRRGGGQTAEVALDRLLSPDRAPNRTPRLVTGARALVAGPADSGGLAIGSGCEQQLASHPVCAPMFRDALGQAQQLGQASGIAAPHQQMKNLFGAIHRMAQRCAPLVAAECRPALEELGRRARKEYEVAAKVVDEFQR